MAVSITYSEIGESYDYNGNTYQVYGQTSTGPTGYGMEPDGIDHFDCSGISYSDEYLFVWVCRFQNTGDASSKITYRVDLQAKINGTWQTNETVFKATTTLQAGYSRQLHLFHVLSVNEIDANATEYRLRTIVADNDDNDQRYTYFYISNCPPLPSTDITVIGNSVGKSLMENGSVKQTFWGKEEGSIDISSIGYADNTTNDYPIDCGGLQVGHYACVANFLLNIPSSISTDIIEIHMDLQGNIDGERETLYTTDFGETEVEGGYNWSWWEVFIIEPNTIWTSTNSYRVRWRWVSQGGNGAGLDTKNFITSNINIDDVKHNAGCLWIDGGMIYYTDEYGYKHKIETDNASDGYVGPDYAGCTWMVNQGLSNMRKLYYVTETGYIWHTHLGRLKEFGESLTPGTQYRGSLWAEGYTLCFVNANGEKVYMGNGDV